MRVRTCTGATCRTSPWPPFLRWVPACTPASWLDALDRLVLGNGWLRARVLAAHRRAFARVLADLPTPRSVAVVGGGLFPRSAILLRERYPEAAITVVDAEAAHLAVARPFLPVGVTVRCARVVDGDLAADLIVLPLAFRGDRDHLLRTCAVPVLVHEWAFRARGRGAFVAWWLGKRVVLHLPCAQPAMVGT